LNLWNTTITTFPDLLYQSGGVPVGGRFTNGKSYFVKPYDGSDSHNGRSPTKALKTLLQAKTKATADKNDVVYLISESNTAASTTDYQSAALDWSKDGVALIGINAGSRVAQRSRIAQLSTATNVDDLFTVSANNCLVSDIEVYHGVNDATSTGAALVSGSRNRFVNCTFAGIGHATQDTAGNYSLKVTGSENIFEDCTIGLDTISRATATYEMYFNGGATRNIFRKCRIVSYAGAAAFTFITSPASGVDRSNLFEDCVFINMPTTVASGTTMNQAMAITGGGSPDGLFIFRNCSFTGVTAVQTSGTIRCQINATCTSKTITNNI
jgi:hypothetical protein